MKLSSIIKIWDTDENSVFLFGRKVMFLLYNFSELMIDAAQAFH